LFKIDGDVEEYEALKNEEWSDKVKMRGVFIKKEEWGYKVIRNRGLR
jgi:hypothetical protein